jgi:transposase
MLNYAGCFSQVYVVCGYIPDLCSGIDKLAALIKAKTSNSPCITDALFLFCGRKADRIKEISK